MGAGLIVPLSMENARTYNALLLGCTLLFAGSLIWLLISRSEVKKVTAALDQSMLKYESLLSEKLLVDKKLTKTSRKLDTAIYRRNVLLDSVNFTVRQLSAKEAANMQLRNSLRTNVTKQSGYADTIFALRQRLQDFAGLTSVVELQRDSIAHLHEQLSYVKGEYDAALRRSIDQTLVIAERKNDKITSKARRTRELVAHVALPSSLNDLSFTVERPDGSVISTENTLSARQLAVENSMTASTNRSILPYSSTKKMEIVYKPTEKLTEGTYVFKIFNGTDYVGSMNVKLR